MVAVWEHAQKQLKHLYLVLSVFSLLNLHKGDIKLTLKS